MGGVNLKRHSPQSFINLSFFFVPPPQSIFGFGGEHLCDFIPRCTRTVRLKQRRSTNKEFYDSLRVQCCLEQTHLLFSFRLSSLEVISSDFEECLGEDNEVEAVVEDAITVSTPLSTLHDFSCAPHCEMQM